ncbi:MAG: signal recognition particle-docking protein FtsY [Eubacteriales bacterium]|jgi:fused signal recognition particle receptor
MGFFDKLKSGLKKTKDLLIKPVNALFSSTDKVDDDFYEELFDLLVSSDVGVEASGEIVERLKGSLKEKKIKEITAAREEFKSILFDMIGEDVPLNVNSKTVLLVVGVNGVGKTTSIGKISNLLASQGKSVVLCGADTFRAAAIEQLKVWAGRVNVPMISQSEGADPAAVVFDACNAAKKQNADVLIVDTAGRLHNKKNLIDELSKINRVISREWPDANRETLLVLDAVTGQNGLIQAREFTKAVNVDGIVLTKLDGTAKGGIVLAIRHMLGIPVKLIGVGEGIDDLQPFSGRDFVNAMFEE